MSHRRPTYQQIADHLGLAGRAQVKEHKDKNGMPIDSLTAAKEWYDRNIRGVQAKGGDGAAADSARRKSDGAEVDPATGDATAYQRKLAAEADCKQVDAERKKIELRIRKGELVERAAVVATVRKMFVTVKGRLENIPDEIVMSLPPEVRQAAMSDMRESIRLALVELADMRDGESVADAGSED